VKPPSLQFLESEVKGTGLVTCEQWSEVMARVLRLNIDWIKLRPLVCPTVMTPTTTPRPSTGGGLLTGGGLVSGGGLVTSSWSAPMINYSRFLDGYKPLSGAGTGAAAGAAGAKGASPGRRALKRTSSAFDALYANKSHLEFVFRFFDDDGNGAIVKVCVYANIPL
jgi:hypothetical protein